MRDDFMDHALDSLVLRGRRDLAERIYAGDELVLNEYDKLRFKRGEVLPAVELSRRDEFVVDRTRRRAEERDAED